jgi:ABC-2 type transport system permease protein
VTGSAGALQTSWLVAHREFTERLRSRAYQLSTVITLLLVAGLLVVPTFFDDPARYEIGLAGSVPERLEDQVLAGAAEPDTEVVLRPMSDAAAIRAGLEEGDIDIGLVDGSTVVTGPDSPPELVTLVTAAAAAQSLRTAAEQLDITPDALGALLSAAPVVEEVEPVDEAEEQRLFLAFIGTLVLFVSIVTYGQWVLQGVVEEKSSRVVEVILGAVQPRHLLGGKVLGIGALGLIQVLAIAATGLVASRLAGPVDMPPVTFGVVMTVLVWFVLGFAFYAAGYAVAGSLVSNNEDAQNASFPLTLLLMAGYFVSTSALSGGGDNLLLQVLSIVPPFSPLVMPLRQVSGDAAAWEVVMAVILMVAAIAAMLRVGGRVYSGGLLRSGGRAKLRDAFRGSEA